MLEMIENDRAIDSALPVGMLPPMVSHPPLAAAGDATLALALIAGDSGAPRIAWARYAPLVRRMLRRAFGSDCEVEDLIQDVFFVLFRKVAGLREPSALKAYVISITAMTIKYEIRRRRTTHRLRPSDAVSPIDRLTTEQPDPSARAALVAFYAVLDRLNESDRSAFVLRFFEGRGVIEVALALGVSVSTAKRRLVRLRRRVDALIRQSPALASFLEKGSETIWSLPWVTKFRGTVYVPTGDRRATRRSRTPWRGRRVTLGSNVSSVSGATSKRNR